MSELFDQDRADARKRKTDKRRKRREDYTEHNERLRLKDLDFSSRINNFKSLQMIFSRKDSRTQRQQLMKMRNGKFLLKRLGRIERSMSDTNFKKIHQSLTI